MRRHRFRRKNRPDQVPLQKKTWSGASYDPKGKNVRLSLQAAARCFQGVSELYEFVKKVDAPVADSLMGKGAFPGTDPLYTGMLGMHGTKTSNYGVTECDLLIVVGRKIQRPRDGKCEEICKKNAKILQIDIDAAEINKNYPDARRSRRSEVVLRIKCQAGTQQNHHEWMKIHHGAHKESLPCAMTRTSDRSFILWKRFIEVTGGDAMITDGSRTAPDVGGTVLSVYEAENILNVWRSWEPWDTVWGRYRRKDGMQGQAGDQHCRRRLLPHEHERNCNGNPSSDSDHSGSGE